MRHLWPVSIALVLGACAGSGGGERNNLVGEQPGPGMDGGDGMDATSTLPPVGDVTPDESPDAGAPEVVDLVMSPLAVGGTARVIASSLNLRSGAGTMNPVLDVMHCGDTVTIVGGPDGYWWNVNWQGPGGAKSGWASGNYLVGARDFDPMTCALPDAGPGNDGGGAMTPDQMSILARAKQAVGYSYYWGHGSWRADGTQLGSCMGSCPNCTHNGSYGADCSGYVAKCWQIPTPSPVTTDLHPYSTYNFYNAKTHWAPLPRAQIKAADALVYNANGAGHIMLFESGNDPWGNIWAFEARGCATGVVHNLRVAAASFITIRREGL